MRKKSGGADRDRTDDLPEEIRQSFPRPFVNRGTAQPLNEIEGEYMIALLELNGGNQTRASEQL